MAGVGLEVGAGARRRAFWLAQAAHQAPMAVSMALMATVLRSPSGMLLIVAGLWVISIARARAARTSRSAREFLVDVLAMALVLVIPLVHGGPGQATVDGMPGMEPLSLGIAGAWVALASWFALRAWLFRGPATPEARFSSLVSGSCCGLGLVAMILF